MTTWSVEEVSGGGVVVTWKRNRRPFENEDEALAFIRKNRSRDDKVVKVHMDGYTTPMTRRRWRRRGSDL